jgi:hypothetical protein
MDIVRLELLEFALQDYQPRAKSPAKVMKERPILFDLGMIESIYERMSE